MLHLENDWKRVDERVLKMKTHKCGLSLEAISKVFLSIKCLSLWFLFNFCSERHCKKWNHFKTHLCRDKSSTLRGDIAVVFAYVFLSAPDPKETLSVSILYLNRVAQRWCIFVYKPRSESASWLTYKNTSSPSNSMLLTFHENLSE